MDGDLKGFGYKTIGLLAVAILITVSGVNLAGGVSNLDEKNSRVYVTSADEIGDCEPSKTVTPPGYCDIRDVEFLSEGETLTITLRVDGEIPSNFSSESEHHYYIFTLMSERGTYKISFSILKNGQSIARYNYENRVREELQGSYEVNESILEIEIPNSKIKDLESLNYKVASIGTYTLGIGNNLPENNIFGTNDYLKRSNQA